jgi:CheY-like chemotaxis protein
VGSGTGLGLSIALGIAEAHHGALELVPSASGSCFRLTLPVSDAVDNVTAEPVEQRRARRITATRTALVVDDERTVRQSLQRLLVSRRFAVDLAKDGEAASALLNARQYDVVLCDVRMPKMGGIALYRFIHTFHPDNLKGFGFISGDILNADVQQFVEHSRIPLLSKPFTAEQLDSFLESIKPHQVSERRLA